MFELSPLSSAEPISAGIVDLWTVSSGLSSMWDVSDTWKLWKHPFKHTYSSLPLQFFKFDLGFTHKTCPFSSVQSSCYPYFHTHNRVNRNSATHTHLTRNYRISRPIRRNFFPKKCDLNSICVLCTENKYYSKLINTSIIQHLYRESENNHEDDFSGSGNGFLGFYDE